MGSPDHDTRPAYVYLLALTALLLFGVNFAIFLADSAPQPPAEIRSHIVVHVPHGLPAAAPLAPGSALAELETAKIYLEQAERAKELARRMHELERRRFTR